MPIIYKDWITREFVRANPEDIFVFGDNAQRRGMRGQAEAMFGEQNAIGVATKWKPYSSEDAFYVEGDTAARDVVLGDLARIQAALDAGRNVIVPADGLGTGLSQLPARAPSLYAELRAWFAELRAWFAERSDGPCPWPAT